MELRYNYRLWPDRDQEAVLLRTFGHCHAVWNWAVGRRRDLWEQERLPISDYDLKAELTDLRGTEACRWLRETSSVPQQQVVFAVGRAFKAWRSKSNPARRPRFKARRRNPLRSAEFTRSGFRLVDGRLGLGMVPGLVDVWWTRDLPSDPTSVVVSLDPAGRWHASFVVRVEPRTLPLTGRSVGVDLGVGDRLWTTSDGEVEANARHLRRKARHLARCQRSLTRRQPGSRNREKARRKAAEANACVADARREHLHRATTALVRSCDEIATQADRPSAWAKRARTGRKRLGKSVADASPGTSRRMITYKAGLYGRRHIECGGFEPTTITCSECRAKTKLGLGDRTWTCSACDAQHDRDVNAACNIHVAARMGGDAKRLSRHGKTKSPKGDEAQPMKQEVQSATIEGSHQVSWMASVSGPFTKSSHQPACSRDGVTRRANTSSPE